MGRGPKQSLGQIGPLRPFSSFLISFCFDFSDLYQSPLANFIQTNSNNFLKSSKNQNKVLNQ
jgi:hypothetical protein